MRRSERAQAGFSLIELLAVVAIIAVMAAVSLPAISRYMKNYQIRGAMQQVAGEVTTARNKAIAKNTNLGVIFLIDQASTNLSYRYILEDAQGVLNTGARTPLATVMTDATLANQLGPLKTLPGHVRFGTTCNGFVANATGMRFDRFGRWCDPVTATASCPAIDATVGATLMQNSAANGSTICLEDPDTGLTKTIVVSVTGRVQTQP
jgi:prepilin-type N-terminal cleavage/methylation domain-containing protein